MGSRKSFLAAAAAAMGLGLLTGCVSHQLDDHSFQFNEATGSVSMRLLLLNAVRASKDYPLQFSKLSSYKGKGAMNHASLGASLPIRLPIEGTLTPKVELNDGISTFDLVDLSTEEAQEALKRQLTHSGFSYHTKLSGNRSSILPQLLLLEQVVLSDKLARVIDESVRCTCKIVDGKQCASPTIDDEASAPLRQTEKSYEEFLRNDPKLRALKEKFKETRFRLRPFGGLTKGRLSALRKAWRTIEANDSIKPDDNEHETFKRYVKMAEDYVQLDASLGRLRRSRSEFIKTLQGSNSVADEMRHACASLETLHNECPNEKYPITMDKKIVLKNDLTTECKHKVFMYGILQSKVFGLATRKSKEEPKPDDEAKKEDDKNAPARTQVKGGNTFQIFTIDPKDDKGKDKTEPVSFDVLNPIFAARCLSVGSCDIGVSPASSPGIRRDEIFFTLRTPERVVRYLGELISAQNYGTQPFQPSILDPERKGQRFTVLTVQRGRPLPGSAAVAIRDPEGETFYIPRRSHDAPKMDLSLETLAIVTDVLNAAVSKKNFPPVAAITVVSP